MIKKKKIGIGIIIVIVIASIISISYAYWFLSFSSTNSNKLATSCLSLSLTSEKNDINLDKAYPILDEEGKKLTPYSFTITNTCDLFLSYTVNLEVLNDSTMPYKYIKTMINNEAITNLNDLEDNVTTLDSASISKVLVKGSLGTGDSADYNIRLWMDESVTAEDTDSMGTKFLAKVTISAQRSNYSPVEQGYDTLADAILVNEYQTTPEISKQKIAIKQAPDFSQTAPILVWSENKSTYLNYIKSTMPHPDLVALKDTDTRFANLTDENILPLIGTSYTFNSSTGLLDIQDAKRLDPTTLNYTGNTKYYFCNSGFDTNSSDVIKIWTNQINCSSIIEVTSAQMEDGEITGSGGSTIKTRRYLINGYTISQKENESDKSDKGLYQMEDNDGISYYYRGSVSNNYVKFAGFYWRIIRINGDGSVRLLYAGTTQNATGSALTNKLAVPYNLAKNNPAYIGYMYGKSLNESTNQTNANEINSNLKEEVDNWYVNNILNTSNEKVIVDAGFCNDRSFYQGDAISGNSYTFYNTYKRYRILFEPLLACSNTNDLFTLSSSSKGNKALLYPIGLITIDELMLSGYAFGYTNRASYTYSSTGYWTMTPSYYDGDAEASRAYSLSGVGSLSSATHVNQNVAIRVVINIKGDAKINGGIGTASSPFEIAVE